MPLLIKEKAFHQIAKILFNERPYYMIILTGTLEFYLIILSWLSREAFVKPIKHGFGLVGRLLNSGWY
jgi:hypothetical protein